MKNKERTFFEIMNKLFKPAFAERIITTKAVLPGIIGSIIGITTVYLLKEITNKIGVSSNDDVVFLLSIFIAFILLWYFILISTRNWIKITFRPIYRKYIYKYILLKYTHADNNESEKIGTGKLIAIFDKGLFSWVDLLSIIITEVIPSFIFIIFSFIFIGNINFYYGIVVFLLFIIISYITIVLQDKAKVYRLKRREVNIGITSKFVNILISKFEILQNGKINNEIEYINKSLDKNITYNKKVGNYNVAIEFLSALLIDGSKIGIIIMFGLGFGTNVINLGEFVSLMSVIYILDQIFKNSISTYIDFTKIIVNVEKIWDFFDNTPEMKGYDDGDDFEYKKGKIELKDVSYNYVTNNPVFTNFNLKLKGGKVTALVGNSGSGKSTLVKLIAGYIRADNGDIIVDGQKLNEVNLKSYYKNIGYLKQEPSVFDGTILDNLTYAIDRELKPGELEKILKQSKCEFIYDLENGLETEIGERGVRLSGGQKQRLAIAKIFLKDPKIIILDEPTSALDSFSEEQITYAMHNLFKGRTVIIIAHRLQTVKEANDIILLENGKIKERGNHKELVKLKGQYKKMLDLQSGF